MSGASIGPALFLEGNSAAKSGYGTKSRGVERAPVRHKLNCKTWVDTHPENIREAVGNYIERDRECHFEGKRRYSKQRRAKRSESDIAL
jgi:hypothetical protein